MDCAMDHRLEAAKKTEIAMKKQTNAYKNNNRLLTLNKWNQYFRHVWNLSKQFSVQQIVSCNTHSITQRPCARSMVVIVIFDVYRYHEANGEASAAHTHAHAHTTNEISAILLHFQNENGKLIVLNFSFTWNKCA